MGKYFILILLLTSLTTCEKVIDIDLPTSESKDVVDAAIMENSSCIVFLTKSQDFYEDFSYPRITGAKIELSDDLGNSEILRESGKEAGIYGSLMMGEVGRTYKLKITTGNNIYEASATIPRTVPIDSIYIYDIKIGKDHIYSPCIVFHDPADTENYYYTTLSVNGKTMKSIYLDDDEFRNGLKVENILFFDKEDNNDEKLKAGDHLKVEMQSLDKGMYTFYKSLRSIAASGSTNPLTNITGGALGCFKAYNPSYIEMVISTDDITE